MSCKTPRTAASIHIAGLAFASNGWKTPRGGNTTTAYNTARGGHNDWQLTNSSGFAGDGPDNKVEIVPMFGTQPPASSIEESRRLRTRDTKKVGPVHKSLSSYEPPEAPFPHEDLVFSIQTLRTPLRDLSPATKRKVLKLKTLHKRVDDDFLDNRIEPRLVILIPEGADIKNFRESSKKKWNPPAQSNLVINLNKFIGKYDYDIAQLICPSNAKRIEGAEEKFRRTAIYEITSLCTQKMSGGKKIYQSLWDFNGR